jgi:hypothetical protein
MEYNKIVPTKLKSTKHTAYWVEVISTFESMAVRRYISRSTGTHNRSSTVVCLEKTLSMYPPKGFTRAVTTAKNRMYCKILWESIGGSSRINYGL